MNIGFVTCAPEKLSAYFPTRAEPDFMPVAPPFTPDDQLAVDQLRDQGFNVMPVIWGTPISLLQHFNLIVIRSPWDYMDNDDNKNQFLAWVKNLELAGVQVTKPIFMEDSRRQMVAIVA